MEYIYTFAVINISFLGEEGYNYSVGEFKFMRIVFAFLIMLLCGFIPSYAGDAVLKHADNAGVQNAADWTPYITELEKKIKKNWNPPRADVSNSVKTSFKLSKDGNLVKYDIVESSGKKSVDDAAIYAIKSAMPYKPFPENAERDTVDIEFSFDYRVLAQKRTAEPEIKAVSTVQKPKWVNVADIKDPIRLLDTDNIYKLNYNGTEGTVFRFRYLSKDKKEQTASFFADFKNNKAGVISIKPYDEKTAVNFALPEDLQMKNISEFKTDFTKIKAYADKNELKNCPEKYLIPPLSEKERALLKNYVKKMDAKIQKNWTVPKGQKESYAVVRLKINKKGEIESSEIIQSSQNEMFNATVMQTLGLSEPFDTIPKEYIRDYIQVNYVFGYNVKANKDGTYEKLYKVNTAANVLSTLLLIPIMILGID